MLAALGASALAATPVLTVGDPDQAVARVARATDTPASDWVGQHPLLLLGTLEPTVQGGTLTPCVGGGRTLAELQTLQVQLQGAVNYVRLDEAVDTVARIDAVLGCLGEPVDPVLAGRVAFMAGVVHHQLGAPDAADAAFGQALAFDGSLVWDPRLSPRLGQERFEAVKGRTPDRLVLSLSPPPDGLSLRIDGVAVAAGTSTLALGPGRHLLQRETDTVRSAWLVVEAASATLQLPLSQIDPAWIDDAAGRTRLARQLALALPEGQPIVWVGDAIWAGEVGGTEWRRVLPPPPPAVNALRLGGLVVGGTGAALAGGVWAWGAQLRRACEDASPGSDRVDTCAQGAATDAWLGQKAWPTALVVAGVGLAAGATGLGLRRLVLAPAPVPGGAGVILGWAP